MECFLLIIEMLAVLAFAYTGFVEARRNGFDYVGVLTVAFVSVFGGGTFCLPTHLRSPCAVTTGLFGNSAYRLICSGSGISSNLIFCSNSAN